MGCLDGINGEYGNLIISGWPLALIGNDSGGRLRVRRKSRSVALPLQPHRLRSMGRTVSSLRSPRTMGYGFPSQIRSHARAIRLPSATDTRNRRVNGIDPSPDVTHNVKLQSD